MFFNFQTEATFYEIDAITGGLVPYENMVMTESICADLNAERLDITLDIEGLGRT